MPTNSNKPHKHWGQHFLKDQATIEQIIAAIRPCADDTIVEIGPGNGALTDGLIQHAGMIDAIEIDRNLATKLRERFGPTLNLHTMDVLDFDFSQIHRGKKLTVVGNLPYNISTPILFHLINHMESIHCMYLMLQWEVATRLIALPGTKNYSKLSVSLACYAKTQLLFDISPTAFTPPPKVTSAFVRIQPQPLLTDPNHCKILKHIVQQAFNHRRKILAKTYQNIISIEQLIEIGIDPTARPRNAHS